MMILLHLSLIYRAEEPVNFFTAPAPDFFLQSVPAPTSGIFFRAALAPAPKGQKNAAPALDFWLSLAKYLFPYKL